MYQLMDSSAHSHEARRNFNIFLSLFGGLMAIGVLIGAVAQALISGGDLDPLPIVLIGSAAFGLVNIAAFLLDEKLNEQPESSVSETDEFSLAAIYEDAGRQLE